MPTSNPPESAGTGDLLRVALPNKGALSEDAVRVFTEAGYRCKRGHSSLRTIDSAAGVEFIFLRPRDIAVYVGEGVIDVGVSGRDLTLDSRANVEELLELQFGHANFRLAVPRGATLDLHADPPTRIATSFTHLLADYLAEVGSKANIIALDGAVELAPSLGVADAVVVPKGHNIVGRGSGARGSCPRRRGCQPVRAFGIRHHRNACAGCRRDHARTRSTDDLPAEQARVRCDSSIGTAQWRQRRHGSALRTRRSRHPGDRPPHLSALTTG